MFQNREEAGLLLAKKLGFLSKSREVIILSIPRGGVVVGKQISKELSIPLSVIVVKKLGAPDNPELALGAIAPAGVKYIDWELIKKSGVEQGFLDKELVAKTKEVEERVKKYQISNIKSQIQNIKTIILVDDGIATGSTTFAAIKYIKKSVKREVSVKVILAVPVIVRETFNKLRSEVSDIIALEIPDSFNAVGEFYKEFPQVSDEEVMKLL